METWCKVDENPLYEVSTSGKVRRKNHIKAPVYNKGYYKVDLYRNGHSVSRRIHRLVAKAFMPNPKNLPEVNHKDGNKLNNNVENLEWVTNSKNMKHAYRTGIAKPSRGMLGKKNPNAGSKGKPIRIVETGEIFKSSMECERKTNYSNKHINDCLKGRQETHRGYHFEYV